MSTTTTMVAAVAVEVEVEEDSLAVVEEWVALLSEEPLWLEEPLLPVLPVPSLPTTCLMTGTGAGAAAAVVVTKGALPPRRAERSALATTLAAIAATMAHP